jgi:hypothetical protein
MRWRFYPIVADEEHKKLTPGHKKMPLGRKTVTSAGHKKVTLGAQKVPRGGRFDSQWKVMLKKQP